MSDTPNGAQALIRTLVDAGVDVCFTNPGTSEMHFVAALDTVPEMRGILGLFEGVVTGAADGYARMAGRPAATLLHLGPGLGNGLANLHNARRAATPMVNIVGDHATHHKRFDAPLDSDIESSARTTAGWMRTSARPEDVARDAAEAVAAAHGPPGQIATLILPADVSWSDATGPAAPVTPGGRAAVDEARVENAAAVLGSGEPTALLIGGTVTRQRGLVAAGDPAALNFIGDQFGITLSHIHVSFCQCGRGVVARMRRRDGRERRCDGGAGCGHHDQSRHGNFARHHRERDSRR